MLSSLFISQHNISEEVLQEIAAEYIADGNRKMWEPFVAHYTTGAPVMTGPFSVYAELYVSKVLRLKAKNLKLKRLMLLTDPVVETEMMNHVAMKQWTEFVKTYPDEL